MQVVNSKQQPDRSDAKTPLTSFPPPHTGVAFRVRFYYHGDCGNNI